MSAYAEAISEATCAFIGAEYCPPEEPDALRVAVGKLAAIKEILES